MKYVQNWSEDIPTKFEKASFLPKAIYKQLNLSMFLFLPVVTGTKGFLVQYSSAIAWMGSDVNTVYICQRWSGLKCMKDVRADSRAKPPHTGLLHLSSNQCHNWLRQTPVGTQMAASFNRPFKLYQAFFSNHTQFMQSHIKSKLFLTETKNFLSRAATLPVYMWFNTILLLVSLVP